MNIKTLIIAGLLLAAAVSGQAAPVETPVQTEGPAGGLEGTMLTPGDGGRAPLVLIIPGSGRVDRNDDSPPLVRASAYRRLAEALAGLGVASVRIDKRGSYQSAGDASQATVADYAADAHAWAASLRSDTGAPCVWLLGHSEGGLVALVAAQNPKDICGLVLVSVPGRPLADILREQLTANPANAPLLAEALPAIDALAAGRHVDTSAMSPALLPIFRPAAQDLLIDEMSYDPAKLVAAYRSPVLVVQGTSDRQVSLMDAHRLAAARPAVGLAELPGVDHMLKVSAADLAATMAAYADPSLPLAPGVAEAIADFVRARGGR